MNSQNRPSKSNDTNPLLAELLLTARASTRPEFIRLPQPKTNCPYTGFSRTGLYNLTVPCKANGYKPAVPAKCLRQPGNLRGIWVIPFERLIAYLHALPTPGMRDPETAKE